MCQWMGLLVNGQVVAAPQSVSVKHKNTWFGSRSFSIDIVSHFFVLCVKDSQVKEAKRFDPWHENERETIIIRNVRHSRHSRHVRRNSGSLFNNGIVRMLLYLCPKKRNKDGCSVRGKNLHDGVGLLFVCCRKCKECRHFISAAGKLLIGGSQDRIILETSLRGKKRKLDWMLLMAEGVFMSNR